METIIVHPDNKEQANLFEQLAKALNVPFERSGEKSPYDPEFVAMIKHADQDFKAGKGRKITLEELDRLCK
ncbi:MAG: DUF2683 family protein [Anditalea sp.]